MSNAALNMKNLLSQGTFSSGETFPKSFVTLFSELCELINAQQDKIGQICDKSSEFATKSEVMESMSYIKSVKTEIDDNIHSVEKNLKTDIDSHRTFQSARMNDLDRRFKNVDDNVSDIVNQKLEALKQTVQQNDLATSQMKNSLDSLISTTQGNSEQLTSIRTQIPPNPESRLTHFSKRIDMIEGSQKSFIRELKEKNENLKDEIKRLHDDDNEMRVELHNTILELEAKAKKMPSTYSNVDDQPKIVNGNIDISPLIKGIYRDSRRLDGFSEMIAMTRMETEDIVNSMIDLQEKMQTFNHITHDLALDDGRIRAMCIERVRFLQSSIVNLEKQIGDIWSLMLLVSDNNTHIASNISQTFEQIQSILTTISNRPLPLLNDLSDVMLECYSLHEAIFERRTQFEGEREKFKKLPSDSENSQNKTIPEIKVRTMQRRMKAVQNTVQLPYEEMQNKSRPTNQQIGDIFVQRSLEELRVKMNEVLESNQILSDQFDELVRKTNENLEIKVDSPTLERMLNKIHSIVGNLTRRIDYVEESEFNIFDAAKNSKRKIKDPNISTVKKVQKKKIPENPINIQNPQKQTYSEVPPLKIGNATKPVTSFINEIKTKNKEILNHKTSERPKSAHKLVSDYLLMPSIQMK